MGSLSFTRDILLASQFAALDTIFLFIDNAEVYFFSKNLLATTISRLYFSEF